jgi:hypothetical protein
MPIASLTALDGGSVEFDSSLAVTSAGATSFVVATIDGSLQEFAAGALAFGDFVARSADVKFDEEYAMQDGRLGIGSAEHVDGDGFGRRMFRLGVWSGHAYCVKTFLYNRPSSDLIGIFGLIAIEERDTGVVIRARARRASITREGWYAPTVVNNVPGLGLLEVWESTAQLERRFPTTGGAHGRGGQLFHDARSAHGVDSLILIGDSTITRIQREPNLPDESFAAAGADLRVTWA